MIASDFGIIKTLIFMFIISVILYFVSAYTEFKLLRVFRYPNLWFAECNWSSFSEYCIAVWLDFK